MTDDFLVSSIFLSPSLEATSFEPPVETFDFIEFDMLPL
jgi:hypothetical protein